MEFIMALFNVWAFGALLIIAVISGLLYAKTASARERLGLMGSFAQSAALAVSGFLAVLVVTSSEIAMEEVGPMVRLVVTITLYGVVFNLACKIWARLLREGPGGSAPLNNSFAGPRPFEAPGESAGAKEDGSGAPG